MISEKRILVASPIREKPEILREYADSLLNLDREGIKADFLFIDDNVDKESVRILQKLKQMLPAVLMDGGMNSQNVISHTKHQWNVDTIFRVSEYRNKILEYAREGDYDGLFFVD